MKRLVQLMVLPSLLAMVIFSLFGCSMAKHSNKFSLSDGSDRVKPGTIAVIAGSGDEKDIKLAAEMTRLLKEKGGFKVMSQKEIEERIPLYPGYFIEKQAVETDRWSISGGFLSESNQASVNRLQEVLKTQYVLVVWTESLAFASNTGCNVTAPFGLGGGDFFRVLVPVRLVSYPKKTVAAYSNILYEEYYSVYRPFNSSIDKLLEAVAVETVKNLGTVLAGGTK